MRCNSHCMDRGRCCVLDHSAESEPGLLCATHSLVSNARRVSLTLMHLHPSPRSIKLGTFVSAATLAALTLAPGATLAQSAQGGTVAPAFREAIPNIPGKSIVAVV